jgi:outer membrane receptor protein involved in Fe transport
MKRVEKRVVSRGAAGWVAGLVIAGVLSTHARAGQDATPAANATRTAETAPTAEIVVTGEKPAVETRVDRTIYNLGRELQATSGSVADVLRNLPSISVDLDGNPSLRGDSDVTILVDGRPAPQYNGANRGAALQQLGADGIERIEVITNPPANLKREGSGGIINIVTKRSNAARTASAIASAGNYGRYSLNTSQGWRRGALNLRGTASLRREPRIRDADTRRVVREDGIVQFERVVSANGVDDRRALGVTFGADYDFGDDDRLTLETDFRRREIDSFFDEQNALSGPAGVPTASYERSRRARYHESENATTLRYRHEGATEGDGLTISATRTDESEPVPLRLYNTWSLPAQPPTLQRQYFDEFDLDHEFEIEHVVSWADRGKLLSGYTYETSDSRSDRRQFLQGPLDGPQIPDLAFTNRFDLRQTTHAAFASYERAFGAWTTLTGLRLEQTDLRLDQRTTADRRYQDYFRVFPTLHVSRTLNERQSLKFSYGRRIVRPWGQQLNSYRYQSDDFTVSEGNPDLEPMEIDSLEAGWSYAEGRTTFGTSLYARRRNNEFSVLATPLTPSLALYRPVNLGSSTSGGLELSASGRPVAAVDLNFSANVYYFEIDAANLGIDGKRSTVSYESKASLSWRIGPDDTLQLNGAIAGKRLTAQGHLQGSKTLDLGYRHKFRSNLSVTATIADVFSTRRFENVLESPELSDRAQVRFAGPVASIAVSWSLPGAKAAPERFDFGEQ